MTDIQDKETMGSEVHASAGDGELAELDRPGEEIVEADGGEDFAESPSSYRFSRKLTVLSDPAGVQSSAVGALRNHLSQQHLGLGRRSLAICSVGDDVNRTLVSANLAIAAAQAGASTMLIDANLRQPEMETYFTPPGDHPGLGDYLAGATSNPGGIIRSDVLPNLSLIHAGSLPADPQALLSGRRFEDLVTGLMRSYDFTIVDCPSARLSSDARRIASVMRYALIVVKRDVTYIDDLKRLIDDLSSDRVTVIGTFLNVG